MIRTKSAVMQTNKSMSVFNSYGELSDKKKRKKSSRNYKWIHGVRNPEYKPANKKRSKLNSAQLKSLDITEVNW